ncbi:ribbon-helix-helix domain-containing protein [Sphingoaurantiacus capsulatus]|uniref:Ribbon-helix-helix domain-containing protein n=1 Tax=Sphingoaurantiacus capsulatus TaxID=1771310 RepID=A0ABV7XCX2_9SPHN
MRILTDIPDEDIEKLDALAARSKRSRAAAIRDAVKLYLVHTADNQDWIARGAGLWKHRTDIGDAVEYQRAMREDRRPYEDI